MGTYISKVTFVLFVFRGAEKSYSYSYTMSAKMVLLNFFKFNTFSYIADGVRVTLVVKYQNN